MQSHAGPKNVCARRQEKQALDGQSSISELLKHLFLNLIFKHVDFFK
jgi:hypothetical protein